MIAGDTKKRLKEKPVGSTIKWKLKCCELRVRISQACHCKILLRIVPVIFAIFSASCGNDSNIETLPSSILTKDWGTATLLENDSTGDVTESEVAIDEQGNAFVVWCQYANTWLIRFSSSQNKWSETKLLVPNHRTGIYKPDTQPHVAVDSAGNAMVVWLETGDPIWMRVWAMQYSANTDTWSAPQLVETNAASDNAASPRVVVDKFGNFCVIWVQGDRNVWPLRNHIWANRYDSTSKHWGNPVQIDKYNTSIFTNGYLQAAVDNSGNIFAIWNSFCSGIIDVWANRYSTEYDDWDTPTLLKTNTMSGGYNLQIAVDGDGNAVAVWEEDDSNTEVIYTNHSIWMNRYIAKTRQWGSSIMIPVITSESLTNPQVVLDGTGNATIVCNILISGISHIWETKYYFNSNTISEPNLILPDEAICQKITLDKYGNILAVFAHQYGSRALIWSIPYNAKQQTWGNTKQLGGENGWGGAYIKLATNKRGDSVATWAQTDGQFMHLWGNISK